MPAASAPSCSSWCSAPACWAMCSRWGSPGCWRTAAASEPSPPPTRQRHPEGWRCRWWPSYRGGCRRSGGLAAVALDLALELLARPEGHHPAGRDRNLLPRLGVAPRPLALVAQVEVAEAGELDLLVLAQAGADLLEEGLHHGLGLALGKAQLGMQMLGQLGLGQCTHLHVLVSGPPHGRCHPRPPGSLAAASPSARPPDAAGTR